MMKTSLVRSFAGALAFALPAVAFAGSYHINPVNVMLSPQTSSALVNVTNTGSDVLRIQTTAFAWSQNDKGEMSLTPTKDIVLFPSILAIKPGETRKLRVGAIVPATKTERTYRMILEELPPLLRTDKGVENGIHVLTRSSVPVFLTPAGASPHDEIVGTTVKQAHLELTVKNSGTAHSAPRTIHAIGLDANGATQFDTKASGWYVLAGDVRHFDVPLNPDECRKSTQLEVSLESDDPKAATAAKVRLSPGDCAP